MKWIFSAKICGIRNQESFFVYIFQYYQKVANPFKNDRKIHNRKIYNCIYMSGNLSKTLELGLLCTALNTS